MQLQELKKLVEYEAIGTLMASKYLDGWSLSAFKKGSHNEVTGDCSSLELARGGIRKFKTLDAIKKLIDSDLYHHKLLVS
jgi:hypothetical protein